MDSVRKNRILDALNNSSAFRILYISSLMLCSVVFIEIAANVARSVLFAWGVYLAVYGIVKHRSYKHIMYFKLLAVFLAFGLITTFIYLDSHFLENGLMVLHVFMCFFVFYGMHTEPNRDRIRNEIGIIAKVFVYSTTILSILGLVLALFIGKSIVLSGYPVPIIDDLFSFDAKFFGYKLIIYENRFTGLYTNPNLLGFTSITALVFCHMSVKKQSLLKNSRINISRKWLIACTASNLLSLFLCDSNSSFIFLVGYIIVFIAYRLFKTNLHGIKETAKRGVVLVVASIVVLAGTYGLRFTVQKASSFITSFTRIEFADETSYEEITYEHTNANIDSGRLLLWKQSLSFIKAFPLFGIGKGNVVDFGKRLIKGGLKYSDFHNGYITIVVCSGILGFIPFILFALLIGLKMCKRLFDRTQDSSHDIFPCIAAYVATYCVFAVVEKTVLFDITFMVVIFWLMLGYGTLYIRSDNSKEETVNEASIKKS